MQNFGIFRALGLSFKAWFRNFIPITLLAAILYSPIIIWMTMLPGLDSGDGGDALANQWLSFFTRGMYLVLGLSTLIPPLVIYRVIEDMNGKKVSMVTSVKYGLRGIIPAVLLAVITNVLSFVPFGGIVGTILTCYWFVAAPAAVAEKLGPGGAFSRSAHLTEGRRWGIFGVIVITTIILIGIGAVVLVPALSELDRVTPEEGLAKLKMMAIVVFALLGVLQLFTGIVQAVSYSLLRTDKEGVSNEELARVFD